jgi:hypothetical protein
MCVEQQVVMFFNTVGLKVKNKLVGTNFNRFGKTVSLYLKKVFHCVGELQNYYISHHHQQHQLKSHGTQDGVLILRCGVSLSSISF